MQLPNVPAHDKFDAVVKAIQRERLVRYMPAAGNDMQTAFAYYLWNGKLCESFLIALHFAEIVCRNTFNNALMAKVGNEWFEDGVFVSILGDRYRTELSVAVKDERTQHGSRMTCHHVVSVMSFGFWDHLSTKRFERFLWSAGVHRLFPHAPKGTSRQDVQNQIESVRRWRNRIAHHRSIFDKGPSKRHGEALDLIGWVCPHTRAWVASQSQVPRIIGLRPK